MNGAMLVPERYRDFYLKYCNVCAENFVKLEDIWEDIGYDQSSIDSKMQKLTQWLENEFQYIVDEELKRKSEMKESFEALMKDINDLSTQLQRPLPTKPKKSLKDALVWAQTTFTNLEQLREKRLAMFDKLKQAEDALRNYLGDAAAFETPSFTSELPTESLLCKYEDYIKELKTEKRMRLEKVKPIVEKCVALMDQIGKVEQSSLEERMNHEPAENWTSLTRDVMARCQTTLQELTEEASRVQKEHAELLANVEKLWNRLQTPESEKADRMADLAYRPSYQSVQGLKLLVTEYEQQVKENIAKLIAKLRQEKLTWMQKLGLTETQDEVDAMETEESSEQVIEQLEANISDLKIRFNEMEHLMKLLKERKELLTLLEELEEAQKNKDRYKNRGGALLQETRKREKVNKNLPAVNNQIMKALDALEVKYGNITIDGVAIREEIDNCSHYRRPGNENARPGSRTPLAISRAKTPTSSLRAKTPPTRTNRLARGVTMTEMKAPASRNQLLGRNALTAVKQTPKVYSRGQVLKKTTGSSTAQKEDVKRKLRKSLSYGEFSTGLSLQSTMLQESSAGKKTGLSAVRTGKRLVF